MGYDVEEEKDEITAPDNQDNVEQDDEQDDEQDQEEEALVEVSANETQVDVNMTDVNKTELEETLKELEEQGEELDFDYIENNFNVSRMDENNTVEVDVEQYDAEKEEDQVFEVDDQELVEEVE